MNYKDKYLKYKNKYLNLKKIKGGAAIKTTDDKPILHECLDLPHIACKNKYLFIGHGGSLSDTITVPENINLVTFANFNELCFTQVADEIFLKIFGSDNDIYKDLLNILSSPKIFQFRVYLGLKLHHYIPNSTIQNMTLSIKNNLINRPSNLIEIAKVGLYKYPVIPNNFIEFLKNKKSYSDILNSYYSYNIDDNTINRKEIDDSEFINSVREINKIIYKSTLGSDRILKNIIEVNARDKGIDLSKTSLDEIYLIPNDKFKLTLDQLLNNISTHNEGATLYLKSCRKTCVGDACESIIEHTEVQDIRFKTFIEHNPVKALDILQILIRGNITILYDFTIDYLNDDINDSLINKLLIQINSQIVNDFYIFFGDNENIITNIIKFFRMTLKKIHNFKMIGLTNFPPFFNEINKVLNRLELKIQEIETSSRFTDSLSLLRNLFIQLQSNRDIKNFLTGIYTIYIQLIEVFFTTKEDEDFYDLLT